MSVLKSINGFFRIARLQILKQHIVQHDALRGLYAATSLGLDGFHQQQERIKSQLLNIQDKFKGKMKENTEEGSKNIIFTEDLKNMLHIATSEDIEVVIKMMKKFNNQNKELRFGNFVFGPVAMRMFYILNKPKEAFECFKSPELQGFFDQIISYQLLSDLLYENQRYDDVLECFKIIQDRQIEGTKYPRNVVVVVFATYYKMNTPDSLNYAINLWKELMTVGHEPARRAITFFARLLTLHNRPNISLEVLTSVQNQNYTTIRNLKVLTLTMLNRLDDTIPILKSILKQEQVQTFNKDVLDTLREHLEKEKNAELLTEFNHLMKIFQEQNHISNLTLDQQLLTEITAGPLRRLDRNQKRFRNDGSWQPRQSFPKPQRFGIRDLE